MVDPVSVLEVRFEFIPERRLALVLRLRSDRKSRRANILTQSGVNTPAFFKQNETRVRFALEIFEVQCVVDLVLRFDRFAETEVVVSFFQHIEAYLFVRLYELRRLLSTWSLVICRLLSLVLVEHLLHFK